MQVAENLVKHVGGTIYLRAKGGGKVIRVPLETSNLWTAKLNPDSRMLERRLGLQSSNKIHRRWRLNPQSATNVPSRMDGRLIAPDWRFGPAQNWKITRQYLK